MPYNTARKYYEGIQTRKDIYLYIIRYLKEHDYPPSIPEIAAGLSISSHTVQNHFGEFIFFHTEMRLQIVVRNIIFHFPKNIF